MKWVSSKPNTNTLEDVTLHLRSLYTEQKKKCELDNGEGHVCGTHEKSFNSDIRTVDWGNGPTGKALATQVKGLEFRYLKST